MIRHCSSIVLQNILKTFSQVKLVDPTSPRFNQESANLNQQLIMQRVAMERDVLKLQVTDSLFIWKVMKY